MGCLNTTSCNAGSCAQPTVQCPDKMGCLPGVPVDFMIKRHDTMPPITVVVQDCDGPLDLTNVIVEVSMWAKAKIKLPLATTDTYFALADCIGFEQSLVGDVIVVDRARAPEQMLVIGHDEINKLVQVQRGYNGSAISSYPRGQAIRIFRMRNAFGSTFMDKEDIVQIDGTVLKQQLVESRVIYNWQPNDTCLPGCYFLEFKLLNMNPHSLWLAAAPIIPTFTSVTPSGNGCYLGAGVLWERRIPVDSEGLIVKIFDDATNELLPS